jgi:hypothetical protein
MRAVLSGDLQGIEESLDGRRTRWRYLVGAGVGSGVMVACGPLEGYRIDGFRIRKESEEDKEKEETEEEKEKEETKETKEETKDEKEKEVSSCGAFMYCLPGYYKDMKNTVSTLGQVISFPLVSYEKVIRVY